MTFIVSAEVSTESDEEIDNIRGAVLNGRYDQGLRHKLSTEVRSETSQEVRVHRVHLTQSCADAANHIDDSFGKHGWRNFFCNTHSFRGQ